MSDNKSIREQMIRKYGRKCMIEASGIRCIPIEQRKKIKGYRKTQEQLTYHHIKEKSKGGKATEDNGAIIKGYNHEWLNQLSEEDREKVNECLQQYKLSVIALSLSPALQLSGQQLIFDFSETLDIPLEVNTKEQEEKLKFNRAKEKRQTQRIIDDYFRSLDDDFEL